MSIDPLAPRDWGCWTLFIYPYYEAVRNISLAFPCCSADVYPPPSLCDRCISFIVGCILLIPLVNTVVFIVLRFFQNNPVIRDDIEALDSPLTPRGLNQIATFNQQRQEIVEELTANCGALRTQLREQLREVEKSVIPFVKHEDTPSVQEHQRMSLNKAPEMTMWDGKITFPLYDDDATTQSARVDGQNVIPSTIFTQLGGLTQLHGNNFMCGYYALFFMLNAVNGQDDHTDRDAFNTHLREWHKMIVNKRIGVWLETHRNIPIPNGIKIPGHGLSWGDMHYLITHCESLSPVREAYGCLMLEMDAFESNFEGEDAVLFFGKSKEEFDTLERAPHTFPLFIILKEQDLHYYLFYAREPGEFLVVHSLNHSISNPDFFDPNTFTKIIQALTGIKTPLQIRW